MINRSVFGATLAHTAAPVPYCQANLLLLLNLFQQSAARASVRSVVMRPASTVWLYVIYGVKHPLHGSSRTLYVELKWLIIILLYRF